MLFLKYLPFILSISFQTPVLSINILQESEPPLSKKATISLITGEPGQELYTRFGHSAIRIQDPVSGFDKVYNYGTFDFNAPGFYTKFLRGKLNYFLSRYDFERMMMNYKYFNQTLYEQELNLNFKEKKLIYQFLITNYLPQNRYYLYDFFYDNCSSRIRDVFEKVLGNKLTFDDEFIRIHKTFRQLLDEYLQEQTPWGDLGIDLVLGLPADKVASTENYMFLPYELYRAFDHASIITNGIKEPFVLHNRMLINSVKIEQKRLMVHPIYLFYALLILMLIASFFELKHSIDLKLVDASLFFVVGLAGLILGLLWFATDHIATKENLNLFWAFPTHLISPFLIYSNKHLKFSAYYFLFWSIFLTLFLVGWNYIPQQFNQAIIPLILLLIFRSYRRYQITKRKTIKYVERSKQHPYKNL